MEHVKARRIIHYDRSFLFHMKSQPICLIKPEGLPDSEIVKGTAKNRLDVFNLRPGAPRNIVDGFAFTPGYVKSCKYVEAKNRLAELRPGAPKNIVVGFDFTPGYIKFSDPQENLGPPGTSTSSELTENVVVTAANRSSEEHSYSNSENVIPCSELEERGSQISPAKLDGSSDHKTNIEKSQSENVHPQMTDTKKHIGEISYSLPQIISGVPFVMSVPMDKQAIMLSNLIKFGLFQSSVLKGDIDHSPPTEVEHNHNVHPAPILVEESTLEEQIEAKLPKIVNESSPYESNVVDVVCITSREEYTNDSAGVVPEKFTQEPVNDELFDFDSEQNVSIHHAKENSDKIMPSQNLYKRVNDILILNQKLLQKFPNLVEQVNTLDINTAEKLKGVTELVFKKGIYVPGAVTACANFCRCLALLRIPVENNENQCLNFKKLLIKKCRLGIQWHAEDEQAKNQLLKDIEAAKTEETKHELSEKYRDLEWKAKRRFLGQIRFVRELFLHNLITERVVHCYMKILLTQQDEDSLKYLCYLLTTIGKALDAEKPKCGIPPNENKMDNYFTQMHSIVNKRGTASRVRIMMQDVIDLRQNNWIRPKERKFHSLMQQSDQVVLQESDEKSFQVQQAAAASHMQTDDCVRLRKANNAGYQGAPEQVQAQESTLGVNYTGCISKLNLNKKSNIELKEFTEDDELFKKAGLASSITSTGSVTSTIAEFNVVDQSASELCQCKQSLKAATKHQEINEDSIQEQTAYDSHLKPTRDRLELFGEYVTDLLKFVAETERRNCQSDVLKVINGYADCCTVKVELT